MPYSTSVPGLPGGPLVTNYPITLKIVPAWRTLNRPGIKAALPRRSVQHGNGNPNSSAAGEANYLYNGAGGRQASYHSASDDKGVFVMIPADEVTWQAADGSGPGNMNGFSNELVEDRALWSDPARRYRAIANTADFMGRVAARLGIKVPEQHWTFNWRQTNDRHDCPNKLRYTRIEGSLAWDIYSSLWSAAGADELRRMGGGSAPDDSLVDKLKDITYAKPVEIPALFETNLKNYETAEGIVSDEDGTEFVFVADVVEAKRETPRSQRASGDATLGPPIKKGERFVVSWVFKMPDGAYWYLTPYWTRVKYADCRRVSDAPLI